MGGPIHTVFPSYIPTCTPGTFSPPTVRRVFVWAGAESRAVAVPQYSLMQLLQQKLHPASESKPLWPPGYSVPLPRAKALEVTGTRKPVLWVL